MIKETLYERLDFLRGHRIIHLGLKTTSRHREVSKQFRPKRAYRYRHYRDDVSWRRKCEHLYQLEILHHGRVRWRSKRPPHQRGKISKIKYSLR